MRIKITDFDIQISAENVCAFLDADKTGELYEEIMDELKEMIPTAYEKIRPVALLGFGSMEGYPVRADGQEIREALFGVYSIGKEMERWSTDLFAAGDYLGGMLVERCRRPWSLCAGSTAKGSPAGRKHRRMYL